MQGKLILNKAWRSEFLRVAIFLLTSFLAPLLTAQFPSTVVTGELVSFGKTSLMLSLPLFWIIPLCAASSAIFRIYNVRYEIDSDGISAWNGILALRQSFTMVRHEDIRSIEADQNLWERILDVGEVEIATAATGSVEIVFQGVRSPKKLQLLLQNERNAKKKTSITESKEAEPNAAQEQKEVAYAS